MNAHKQRIAACLLMVAVYSIFFLLVREPFVRYHLQITRRLGHAILLGGIIVVYLIGVWGLRSVEPHERWLSTLWHLAHAVLIGLVAVLGLADIVSGGLPQRWRMLAQTLSEALVSPVLYIVFLLLRRFTSGMSNEKSPTVK